MAACCDPVFMSCGFFGSLSFCCVFWIMSGIVITLLEKSPANIIYKSIAGRYRPVSYPDGPITARYRFIKNAYWEKICYFAVVWFVYCLSWIICTSSWCHS